MSQLTVDQAISLALDHQRAGQLAEAEEAFRQVLDAFPDQPDALHLLGAVYLQAKRPDLAEARVRQAIGVRDEPAFHLTLGIILQSTQRLDEALAHYRELVARHPQLADGYIHLGVLLSLMGRYDEAIPAFREAVTRAPGHPVAQGNLGLALCHLKRWEEAIDTLRHAIALNPADANLHASLAAAYFSKNQLEPALASAQTAVGLNPKLTHAHAVMTRVLHALGRAPDSPDLARQAAALLPNEINAQLHFGESLHAQGLLDEAAAHYRTVLARHPHNADLHNNLANILKDQGLLDEAIAQYRKAIAIPSPDPAHFSNLLYTLLYHPAYTPEKLLPELTQYDQQIVQPLAAEIKPHAHDKSPPSPTRRLRIGYISSEFRQHALGLYLFPLLSNHDKSQFEIFCYSSVAQPDFYTFRFRQLADHWRDLPPHTSDAALAGMIRADHIDILIDLHQHIGNNRLPVFARKPAPVQLSFAGYPGPTNISTIDFRLTDPHLDPPSAPKTHDVPLTIPTFWCYHPVIEVPVNDLPSAATPARPFTFGNLNNFCKLNEPTFALWAQVLKGVKDSHLLLLAPEGSHRDRTRAVFQKHGIAPERIRFSPRLPTGDYYQLFHQIDLTLDSFPYNGHTTSLDSFFMGVPVTTIIGDRPVARATWSQLNALDLPILAAKSETEFIDLSTRLAHDRPWLTTLRRTLRDRMKKSALMNAKAFAQSIEAAYRQARVNAISM